MNHQEYREAYFTEPRPEQRYIFSGSFGVTLFFEDFDVAVEYYEQVLGPPAYVEGKGTKGWEIGAGWLTLLRGTSGNPQNAEMTLQMESPAEAERLQQTFIDAGGTGPPPSDELMYEPVRFCSVCDPLGTNLLIIARLEQ
jgi:hypothetical protein